MGKPVKETEAQMLKRVEIGFRDALRNHAFSQNQVDTIITNAMTSFKKLQAKASKMEVFRNKK